MMCSLPRPPGEPPVPSYIVVREPLFRRVRSAWVHMTWALTSAFDQPYPRPDLCIPLEFWCVGPGGIRTLRIPVYNVSVVGRAPGTAYLGGDILRTLRSPINAIFDYDAIHYQGLS
jgi:hypothetical protein